MEPVLGPLYETGIHMDQEVDLLKRQYLQLIEPDQLSIPALEGMRKPGLQARIFQSMFEEGSIAYPPPDRYKIRVLKKLIDCMEKAIIDPEEDVGFPCFLLQLFLACMFASAARCRSIYFLYH